MAALPQTRTDLRVSPRPGDEDNGLLVYDPIADRGHILDVHAARTFAALDGSVDRDDLRSIVAPHLDPALADAVVDQALAELTDCGLLERPVSGNVSRRAMLVGGAIGLAGVVALPLIRSVPKASALNISPVSLTVVGATATAYTGVSTPITLTAQNPSVPSDVVMWTVTQPAHGTVTIDTYVVGASSTTATAHYTPNAGYTGADSFTYTAGVCVPLIGVVIPYPVPSGTCPSGQGVPGGGVTPATVTLTVTTAPTTTTSTTTSTTSTTTTTVPEASSTPRYTG